MQFIKDRLLRLRPREDADIEGWVYVYYRQIDEKMIVAKRLSHLILYKVGRTKQHPDRRVHQQ